MVNSPLSLMTAFLIHQLDLYLLQQAYGWLPKSFLLCFHSEGKVDGQLPFLTVLRNCSPAIHLLFSPNLILHFHTINWILCYEKPKRFQNEYSSEIGDAWNGLYIKTNTKGEKFKNFRNRTSLVSLYLGRRRHMKILSWKQTVIYNTTTNYPKVVWEGNIPNGSNWTFFSPPQKCQLRLLWHLKDWGN